MAGVRGAQRAVHPGRAELEETMIRILLTRLRDLVIVLFIVSTMLFFIVRLLPGDPAQQLLGANATPEAVAKLRVALGLNGPLYIQYLSWLGRIAHGDFGVSYLSGDPVLGSLLERLPVTLTLAILSLAISFLLAVTITTINTTWPQSRFARFWASWATFGFSVPDFWIALILVWVFGVILRWFPTAGYVPIYQDPAKAIPLLVLPIATLCFGQTAQLVLVMREAMLGEMSQLYLRTARAKGLREFAVVFKHVLPNSLLPVLTVLGLNFAFVIGGVVIIETIFGMPGLGTYLFNAIDMRDYSVIQGGALLVAGMFVIVNLIVDLLYLAVDPKVRIQ